MPSVTDTDAQVKRVMEKNKQDSKLSRADRNAKNGRRAQGNSAFSERMGRAMEDGPAGAKGQRRQPKVITDPSMKKGDKSPPTFGFRRTAAGTDAQASAVKNAQASAVKTVKARAGGTGIEGSPET
jgi:hypothetical protein